MRESRYPKRSYYHRDMFDKPPYYPSQLNFGIIPAVIGLFFGIITGGIIFLSYASKMMGW
ncbi:MAG: hypothetical protein WC637_16880 [Victivallales bacterium]|jgi:hypothetical protein